MPRLVYQRWLEFDLPEGIRSGDAPAVPMWAWPVTLGDGSAMVTLLYRPLTSPDVTAVGPRCVILQLNAAGDSHVWPHGKGYPAPVLFYANEHDELFGYDLTKRGSVYACRADGTHLHTLELSLKMDNLIAPSSFYQRGEKLHWTARDNTRMAASLTASGLRDAAPDTTPPPPEVEVRFPHTHVCADGSLLVFDFDPMPRVSRYQLS